MNKILMYMFFFESCIVAMAARFKKKKSLQRGFWGLKFCKNEIFSYFIQKKQYLFLCFNYKSWKKHTWWNVFAYLYLYKLLCIVTIATLIYCFLSFFRCIELAFFCLFWQRAYRNAGKFMSRNKFLVEQHTQPTFYEWQTLNPINLWFNANIVRSFLYPTTNFKRQGI